MSMRLHPLLPCSARGTSAALILATLLTTQSAAAQTDTPPPPAEPAPIPVPPPVEPQPPPAAAPTPMVPFVPVPAPPAPVPWTPPASAPAPWAPPPRNVDLSASGLPLSQRGRVGFDIASYLDTAGERGASAVELVASMPLTAHTFVDVSAPLGFLWFAGNPSLGARHVRPVGPKLFASFGGAVGLPLMADKSTAYVDDYSRVIYDRRTAPSGYWNYRLYALSAVPVTATFGLEAHRGPFELRFQAEPTWFVGLGDEPGPDSRGAELSAPSHRDQGLLPHALEAQVGHHIAGGLRLQGVVVGWGGDNYQAAVEPFFSLEKELFMLRLGLLLPLDSPLGPPFEESWGFRFGTGIRLE